MVCLHLLTWLTGTTGFVYIYSQEWLATLTLIIFTDRNKYDPNDLFTFTDWTDWHHWLCLHIIHPRINMATLFLFTFTARNDWQHVHDLYWHEHIRLNSLDGILQLKSTNFTYTKFTRDKLYKKKDN